MNFTLKSIKAKEILANIPYPDFPEFVVKLKYCGVAEFEKLQKSCSREKYNPKKRETSVEIDETLFKERLANDIVIGWSGLTVGIARNLMPVDESLFPEGVDNNTLVPDDIESRIALLDNSLDFNRFITNTISDLYVFEKYRKEKELDNLK